MTLQDTELYQYWFKIFNDMGEQVTTNINNGHTEQVSEELLEVLTTLTVQFIHDVMTGKQSDYKMLIEFASVLVITTIFHDWVEQHASKH